jgi:hypothetical protein
MSPRGFQWILWHWHKLRGEPSVNHQWTIVGVAHWIVHTGCLYNRTNRDLQGTMLRVKLPLDKASVRGHWTVVLLCIHSQCMSASERERLKDSLGFSLMHTHKHTTRVSLPPLAHAPKIAHGYTTWPKVCGHLLVEPLILNSRAFLWSWSHLFCYNRIHSSGKTFH